MGLAPREQFALSVAPQLGAHHSMSDTVKFVQGSVNQQFGGRKETESDGGNPRFATAAAHPVNTPHGKSIAISVVYEILLNLEFYSSNPGRNTCTRFHPRYSPPNPDPEIVWVTQGGFSQ